MSKILGKTLRLARQFHRVNQTVMATRLAISKSYLSEIEAGDKVPTLSLLEKFADELELPLSSLLMIKESVENNSLKTSATKKAIRMMEWIAEADSSNETSKEAA